jgi:hypothetical protein
VVDAVHLVEGDAGLGEAEQIRRRGGCDVFGLVVLEHDHEDVVEVMRLAPVL